VGILTIRIALLLRSVERGSRNWTTEVSGLGPTSLNWVLLRREGEESDISGCDVLMCFNLALIAGKIAVSLADMLLLETESIYEFYQSLIGRA
jgi:hypothetical protein